MSRPDKEKIETPALFQLALAIHNGFRPLKLIHRHPNYVRVAMQADQASLVVEVLPHELAGKIRPLRPPLQLLQWWEESRFTGLLFDAITSKTFQHDLVYKIVITPDGKVVSAKQR